MKALEIRNEYMRLKSILIKTEKAIEIIEKHKHISGVTVESKATIKAWFDLENNCARINKAVISTMGSKDLTNGWLKLNVQSSDRYKTIDLDDFMNLPDWEMSLEKLECRIIS
jgi:hypothetical protein